MIVNICVSLQFFLIFSRDNIMRKLFLSLIAAAMIASAAMAREEVTPMTVEIKVIGKRVHRKIELTQEELNKRIINNDYNRTLENLRAYAVFITSGVYDCDLIVGARFNFEITDHGATIEIYGYPANFVNWGGKGEALPTLQEVNPNYGK